MCRVCVVCRGQCPRDITQDRDLEVVRDIRQFKICKRLFSRLLGDDDVVTRVSEEGINWLADPWIFWKSSDESEGGTCLISLFHVPDEPVVMEAPKEHPVLAFQVFRFVERAELVVSNAIRCLVIPYALAFFFWPSMESQTPQYLVDIDWDYVPIPFSDDCVAIDQAARSVVEEDDGIP